jgi:DNA-binding NarL/FixJ family response regulator
VIRVLIADDQALARSGLRVILEAQPDIAVVGEVTDGRAAVEAVPRVLPDVVLMDVRMSGMDGIEATRQLATCADGGAPGVLVLTAFDTDDSVDEAIEAGARGFVLKDAQPEEMAFAVRTVAAGGAFLSPSVMRRRLRDFTWGRRPPRDLRDTLAGLTDRERDVLRQLSYGMSNREISRALNVAETTVRTHMVHLLTKLGARDRVRAVIFAYEAGLVRAGGERSSAGASRQECRSAK